VITSKQLEHTEIPELRGVARTPLPDGSSLLRFCWGLGQGIAQWAWNARLRNAHHIPKHGPAMLCANHPTWLDPALMFLLSPRRPFIMAWDKLFRVPAMEWFMYKSGSFPVQQGGGERDAIINTTKLLAAGRLVGIFPEGGRSNPDGSLRKFRPGPATFAIRGGATIVPITINGALRTWPRGTMFPRPGGKIEYICHPPIVPPATGKAAAKSALPGEITAQLRETIASIYTDAPKPPKRLFGVLPSPNGDRI
jgi:1-acyl-sn-glycerol-3-phosphate acyltransferase